MKIDFNTETTYGDGDDKYIKTTTKAYKDSTITHFYNKNGYNKIPKEKVPHKCLSIIILDLLFMHMQVLSTNIFRRMQICERKYKK